MVKEYDCRFRARDTQSTSFEDIKTHPATLLCVLNIPYSRRLLAHKRRQTKSGSGVCGSSQSDQKLTLDHPDYPYISAQDMLVNCEYF